METFVPIRFRHSIQLTPSELRADFEAILLQKIREALEGVCSRHGYIRPGSLHIVRRSAGQFVKQHFNGHVKFDVVCRGEVCNPPKGAVVKAQVRMKNEMGVLAESFLETEDGEKRPVLDIIVPLRAAGITSELDLDKVQTGDEILVSILSKRFQLHDKKISVIGKAVQATPEGAAEGADDVASLGSVEDLLASEEDEDEEDLEGGSDDEAPKPAPMGQEDDLEERPPKLEDSDEELEELPEEDEYEEDYDESGDYPEEDGGYTADL